MNFDADIVSGASGRKLPEQDNYEIAYNKAVSILSEMDINIISSNSGAEIVDNGNSKYLELVFINNKVRIFHPHVDIDYIERDDEISLWHKILILHYLVQAKGMPLSEEQITFRQLSGGTGYYPAFQNRSTALLLKRFKGNFADFIIAGERIGGIRDEYGDYSLIFRPFPNVKLTFVLWDVCNEFPAEGNIIFDSSIADYFTTEDIAVLCSIISIMIIKNAC